MLQFRDKDGNLIMEENDKKVKVFNEKVKDMLKEDDVIDRIDDKDEEPEGDDDDEPENREQ